MKDLRIVFMGTPDFAVASLKALFDAHYHIAGVITAPDKPAGRGRKLNQSAVKQFAISKDLRILQPVNMKDPDFLLELSELQADLQIVVAFRMLPKQVWSMPKLGTFNLHASLLPDYRGAAPINWAIINGERKTGVTTFFINEDIDTGEIIQQEIVEISDDLTAGALHDMLVVLGSKTVMKTVQRIERGNIGSMKQKEGKYHQAPKLNKENCRIEWNRPAREIYNQIRGLNPYPGAWTVIDNNGQQVEIKIYNAIVHEEAHLRTPGSMEATKKQLRVACQNGFLQITDLKMAGKKRMDILSLLNGYVFQEGSKML